MILQKTCLVCNKFFQKPYNESLRNWNYRHKYCSKKCADEAPRSEKTREKQRLAKIGKSSWNKGVPMRESTKRIFRKLFKGRKLSEETKKKMRGRIPWNKIGNGVTKTNERIRKSPDYKKWRKMVYERDNYTCVICGLRSCKDEKVILQADHIKPFSLYPRLRLRVSNGRTMCVFCHRKTKSYGINQWTTKSNKNRGSKGTNAA